MSLLFWDSFDHYATGDLTEKWTSLATNDASGTIDAAYGRNGTNGLRVYASHYGYYRLRATLSSSPTTVVFGFAFYAPRMPVVGGYVTACCVLDGATVQASLRVLQDGTIQVWRGLTTALVASSSPGAFPCPGCWHYLEAKITIGGAAGAAEVRVNTAEVINASGLNTQVSGAAQVTQFQIYGDNVAIYDSYYYDDLYVLDTAGATCNDFLGDIRVYLLMPEGAGAHADWTPLVGANWQEVDDNPPDDDTTYNASNTVTDRDSFEMEDMPGGWTGTIHAVGVAVNSRRDDAVAHELEPSVRSGGTDYDGAAELIDDDYSFYNLCAWEVDPDTAAAWILAGVNAMECGYELTV